MAEGSQLGPSHCFLALGPSHCMHHALTDNLTVFTGGECVAQGRLL